MILLQRKKVSIHFVSLKTEFETTIRNLYASAAFADCHSNLLQKANGFSISTIRSFSVMLSSTVGLVRILPCYLPPSTELRVFHSLIFHRRRPSAE